MNKYKKWKKQNVKKLKRLHKLIENYYTFKTKYKKQIKI